MDVTYLWPPWLSGSYHPRSNLTDDAVVLSRNDYYGQPVLDRAQVMQAVRLAPRVMHRTAGIVPVVPGGPRAFHDDQEIMLAVVAQNGNLLKVASARVRASKEVVMAPVRVRAVVGRRGPP